MRTKVFSQLDTRWAGLPYPNKKYTIATSGCGCCSVTNVIIETSEFWMYTPKDVQPYMKQFAVPGQGTRWAGITKSLEHYNLKTINHATTGDLFKTLNKRKSRMGILLLRAGTKNGITWTTQGHYVAFTGYKYKDGKHYFYIKDSGGRRHTGWYCYEKYIRGLVVQCWSACLKDTTGKKLCKQAIRNFKKMQELGFKYQVNGNASSWTKALKQKISNCATYVSYDLQSMGLLKEDKGQILWCSKGKVHYKGKGTEAQLKKVAEIKSPRKKPKDCMLRKGDICGYKDPAHTQIFYKYDKNGNALWYSYGPSDVHKKLPRKRGNYNTKKIMTIIRLK